MQTQQFKSVDLRTIVTRLINGQPINGVNISTLYNLDSGDIDEDVTIVNEYTDKLSLLEYQINKREKQLKQKGGNNETQKRNETSEDSSSSERRTPDLKEENNE